MLLGGRVTVPRSRNFSDCFLLSTKSSSGVSLCLKWIVLRFRAEHYWFDLRRSAPDFHTPSAHVRRQSLPIGPPTLNKVPLHISFYLLSSFCLISVLFRFCIHFIRRTPLTCLISSSTRQLSSSTPQMQRIRKL